MIHHVSGVAARLRYFFYNISSEVIVRVNVDGPSAGGDWLVVIVGRRLQLLSVIV